MVGFGWGLLGCRVQGSDSRVTESRRFVAATGTVKGRPPRNCGEVTRPWTRSGTLRRAVALP